jgi:hypothetical protein
LSRAQAPKAFFLFLRPPAALYQPGQRREPQPVEVIPPRPAAHLPAQHLILLTHNQELDLLGQVRPKQHHQQAG